MHERQTAKQRVPRNFRPRKQILERVERCRRPFLLQRTCVQEHRFPQLRLQPEALEALYELRAAVTHRAQLASNEHVGQPLVFDLKASARSSWFASLPRPHGRASSQPQKAGRGVEAPPRLLGRPDTRTTLFRLRARFSPPRQSNRKVRTHKELHGSAPRSRGGEPSRSLSARLPGPRDTARSELSTALQAEGRGSRARVLAPRHGFRSALRTSACPRSDRSSS